MLLAEEFVLLALNGSVRCWGADDSAQLGFILFSPIKDYGTIPGHMGDGLVAPNLGTGRTAWPRTGVGAVSIPVSDALSMCGAWSQLVD